LNENGIKSDGNLMLLRAGQFEFRFPRAAMIMGIVNVTPDSFSDGGMFFDAERAVAHALEMAGEGADLIDIGGESTRPGAAPVDEAEEIRRVIPVIERLRGKIGALISIDTQKPGVARAALEAGASIVNDVGANREAPAMWERVAEFGAGYVAMHMKGTPQTMQKQAEYENVVGEVSAFFEDRLGRLEKAGVSREQIVLDVGIGFGKTLEHNLELLGALKSFKKFERPLLLGVSRKSFIGRLFSVESQARLPAGLACACWAVESGVQIIRTHDVAQTLQAVRMLEAVLIRQTA
jgi:dihydropteroate synthase